MHQISQKIQCSCFQCLIIAEMIEWISRKYSVHSKMLYLLMHPQPHKPLTCWPHQSLLVLLLLQKLICNATSNPLSSPPHMLSNLIQSLLFLSSTTLNSTSKVNYVLFLFSSLQLVLILLHHGCLVFGLTNSVC